METAVGLAISFTGGVVLTILGAILIVRFQRQRRQIGYEILGANVIIPKLVRPNPGVQVMVKQSVLDTGCDDPDDISFVNVDEVYGFRVKIRNGGNSELVNQPVTFQFSPETKVILADLETCPEFGGGSPGVHIDNERSRVTVTFPFLNVGDAAIVSIQTLYSSDLSCKVIAAGPGLYSFDMATRRAVATVVVETLVMLGLGAPGGILLALAGADVVSGRARDVVQTLGTLLVVAAVFTLPLIIPAAFEAAAARRRGRKAPRSGMLDER